MAPVERRASKRQLPEPCQQSVSPHDKQHRISQLFSSPPQAGTPPSPNETKPPTSLNKRRKLDTASVTPLSTKPASVANMYNFSKTNNSASVDLTRSPTSPSKFKRVGGGARLEEHNPATGGPKRLTIKGGRINAKTDHSEYCRQTFAQLEDALTAIFENKRPGRSNEELYRAAENICKLGKAEELSTRLFGRCREHVLVTLKGIIVASLQNGQKEVLAAVLNAWSIWYKQLMNIRSILFYLDRAYLLQKSKKGIYDTAVEQFQTIIFESPELKNQILDGICALVSEQRAKEASNSNYLKDSIKMLHDLGVYTLDFEPRLLGHSQDFIAEWSERECKAQTISAYVAASVSLIDAETKRCEQFNLDQSTRRALLTLLEHHIIERREHDLTAQDAIADLLEDDAVESLEQLYLLLERRRFGAKLKTSFATWIDDTGSSIVFDEKRQDEMVVRLLLLKQKLDNIWRVSFHKDDELGRTLRESFETFINKSKKTSATWNTDNSKPGEMIAKFVDQLLKSGTKGVPMTLASATGSGAVPDNEDGGDDGDHDEESKVNNQLDQVLDLFRFVHGKAVFEAFYKKDLARRLLLGRSASNDAERSMLDRLKTECGSQFTSNLEQMFKDVELAREEMNTYKSRTANYPSTSNIDLNVNILSAASWPSYPNIPVAVPSVIKRAMDDFEAYYKSKHRNRNLQWKHALAHCQLKASFPKGNKEIIVSSFQAIILLLFSGRGKDENLSYEYIKSETGLEDSEVKRTLQSLACAKVKPLLKHPRGRDVNATDTFTVNIDFSHDKFRFKINAIQQKETKEENKQTHERVAADRQFETQAAIVRIMKSRKTIQPQELIAEVISATRTRGVLSVADIKKNIDKLIDKDYMERDEDTGKYNYVA